MHPGDFRWIPREGLETGYLARLDVISGIFSNVFEFSMGSYRFPKVDFLYIFSFPKLDFLQKSLASSVFHGPESLSKLGCTSKRREPAGFQGVQPTSGVFEAIQHEAAPGQGTWAPRPWS